MIDLDRLAGLMAEFEAGKGDYGPFDVEGALTGPQADRLGEMAYAFAQAAAVDTRVFGGDDASLTQAGLLQGLAIGYAYAQGEVNA